jgi:hypothetical protein
MGEEGINTPEPLMLKGVSKEDRPGRAYEEQSKGWVADTPENRHWV